MAGVLVVRCVPVVLPIVELCRIRIGGRGFVGRVL